MDKLFGILFAIVGVVLLMSAALKHFPTEWVVGAIVSGTIWYVLAHGAAFALELWVEREQFHRRNGAGVELFESFAAAKKAQWVEANLLSLATVFKITATLVSPLAFLGLLGAVLWGSLAVAVLVS